MYRRYQRRSLNLYSQKKGDISNTMGAPKGIKSELKSVDIQNGSEHVFRDAAENHGEEE